MLRQDSLNESIDAALDRNKLDVIIHKNEMMSVLNMMKVNLIAKTVICLNNIVM